MKLIKSLLLFSFIICPLFLFAQKDTVLVKEASFRYEYKEFELEKSTHKYQVAPAGINQFQPSQLMTATETIILEAARVKYEITEPIYKTVKVTQKVGRKKITYEKQVLVKKATIKKITIPGKYKVISKTVICCPDARLNTGSITASPAKYETYDSVILKRKSSVKRVEMPAEYKIIE